MQQAYSGVVNNDYRVVLADIVVVVQRVCKRMRVRVVALSSCR